jgi:hypothetical protein
VFRIGAHIPVPGIDPNVLAELFKGQQGGILGMFNMFSGGALSRFTIFALGIMPYISASIIMQLMTAVSPQLEQLRKEGETGRRKITQYTRYGTGVPRAVPGDRHLDRAGIAGQPGARPGPHVPHHHGDHAGDRHHVPDVAGRADHRARPGQRHLDHHLRRHRRGPAERDRRHAGAGAHRRDASADGAADRRVGGRRDRFRLLRRARAAQDPRQLRQAPGRQPRLRRPELAPAVQAQHVGRDPADLRFVA